MKVLKKNQLIILVISLMLVTAGYLNFTSEKNRENDTTATVAQLGDATLVYSNEVENEVEKNENVIENKEEENIIDNNTEETGTTQVDVKDTYFTTSKLERDNIYSQMLETYQEIYNNTNSTTEQKNNAINEIAKINKTRNAIMIAENLVVAKGFEDIVIFANDNSVSIIIKAEKLEAEQIAQIQNIASRELNVGAELINISTK